VITFRLLARSPEICTPPGAQRKYRCEQLAASLQEDAIALHDLRCILDKGKHP